MTKITGKPRKPRDNVRAAIKRIAALEKRIAAIEQALRGKG